MTIIIPQCVMCQHYVGFNESGETHRCKAFNVIPKPIWDNQVSHEKPYPGDKGIQYLENEPKK